jgi:hypothetical protein
MAQRVLLAIQFAFLGILYFPIALCLDTGVFFYNLYSSATKDFLNDDQTKTFSREGLRLFDSVLDEIIYELEVKKHIKGKLMMPMTEVTIILQEKFDIVGEVFKLIFDNKDEGKFTYNQYTKKN